MPHFATHPVASLLLMVSFNALLGKQLPIAHLFILPVAHAPALPLPRHWYLITRSAPPPCATGILFTRSAFSPCAAAND
jgi:hypothetical protein